jgi:hypothetical protein
VGGEVETGAAGDSAAGQQFGAQEAAPAQDGLTLGTMCACGHTRRYHRGLRIEVTGPCLECGCDQFSRGGTFEDSDEDLTARIRAGLDQVERLKEIVARLRGQLSD